MDEDLLGFEEIMHQAEIGDDEPVVTHSSTTIIDDEKIKNQLLFYLHERYVIDLQSMENTTQQEIITFQRIYGFMNYKIKASIQAFEEDGDHTLCIQSIRERFPPSLKRLMIIQNGPFLVFDMNLWRRVRNTLLQIANHANLPDKCKAFLPITKPILAYLSSVFPQGTL